MRAVVVISLCIALVAGVYGDQTRIVGGSLATISQYPSQIGVLYAYNSPIFYHYCSGTLINQNSVLTAASCTLNSYAVNMRLRAESSYSNSGGTVYPAFLLIIHPYFNSPNPNYDISIIRSAVSITYVNLAVQPATFAGANYIPPDGAPLTIAGWGNYGFQYPSDQLRAANTTVANQQVCRNSFQPNYIQDTVFCSSAGGVGPCAEDYGSPAYHQGVVDDVTTTIVNCGNYASLAVYARVSSFITWIQNNA